MVQRVKFLPGPAHEQACVSEGTLWLLARNEFVLALHGLVLALVAPQSMSWPRPTPSRSASAASPLSGAEATRADEEARLGHLLGREPSDAMCRCLPGICPWCVLRCRHGDLRDGLSSCRERREYISDSCPRGRFILQHCKTWIIDLAEADARQPMSASSSSDEVPGAQELDRPFDTFTPAAPTTGWLSTPPAHGSSVFPPPPCWAPPPSPPPPPGLQNQEAGWALALPPPPPPVKAATPGMLGWRSSGTAASSGSAGQPLCDAWQYYAGRKQGWVDYPHNVSRALSCMCREGPYQMPVVLNGRNYNLDVETMTQNNPATRNPPRAIRVRPPEDES